MTLMGHVDHGKTTLLDAIRKTNVVAAEHGGITQHIGAYQITFQNHPITFVDTPGHAAFEKMRSRGAEVADIAILVVAANDGVKPQTIEAIKHIRAAGKSTIVAITKVDLPNINLEKVKKELQKEGVIVESFGGEVPLVEARALKIYSKLFCLFGSFHRSLHCRKIRWKPLWLSHFWTKTEV